MDPLSLTASVLTVIGAGAQTIKLLGKAASLRHAPLRASTLHRELSDLRQGVLAIQDILNDHSAEFAAYDCRIATRGNSAGASLVRSLQRADDVTIKLDILVGPLLAYSLRSDVPVAGKWIRWAKEDSKLKTLEEEVRRVRGALDTALQVLNLSTTMNLKTQSDFVASSMARLQKDQAQIPQSYTQGTADLKALIERSMKAMNDQYYKSGGQDNHGYAIANHEEAEVRDIWEDSPRLWNAGVANMALTTSRVDGNPAIVPHCHCSCHERYSKRSSRHADKAAGSLTARYSGVPFWTISCDHPGCARSWGNLDFMFLLIYCFPLWILPWVIVLGFRKHTWGFDFNLRVLRCVSYSSPMFQFAYQGDVPGMKSLLKGGRGSPFDVTSEPQRSLLGVAASRGHGKICEILLHEGADPFFLDHRNRSAIDIAWEAALTKDKIAKNLNSLLVLSSSEAYAKKSKMGSVHKAVLGLHRLDVKSLLAKFPDHTVDEQDINGQTALYWAALRADNSAVSYLLQAGADADIKNKNGAGILVAALMSKDVHCIQEILAISNAIDSTDVDGYTPLHHSCRRLDNTMIVQSLLDRGADSDAVTALGHSPLMIATFNKRTATAKLLIENGVDVDLQGKDGGCALHHAIMVGDHETVRYLLEHQAKYGLKTNANETILHFTAQRNGDLEILRILEDFNLKGIDIGERSQPYSLTALQTAERYQDRDEHWLGAFKALILGVRLRSCSQEYADIEFVDAPEYQI